MSASKNASSCDCVDSWVVETVLEGVLLPGIGTLGILGNILVLIVFRQSYIKTSTFFLLLAILVLVEEEGQGGQGGQGWQRWQRWQR